VWRKLIKINGKGKFGAANLRRRAREESKQNLATKRGGSFNWIDLPATQKRGETEPTPETERRNEARKMREGESREGKR
jgi:hypothetical protein